MSSIQRKVAIINCGHVFDLHELEDLPFVDDENKKKCCPTCDEYFLFTKDLLKAYFTMFDSPELIESKNAAIEEKNRTIIALQSKLDEYKILNKSMGCKNKALNKRNGYLENFIRKINVTSETPLSLTSVVTAADFESKLSVLKFQEKERKKIEYWKKQKEDKKAAKQLVASLRCNKIGN